jgi:hypothetical protein
LGSNRERSRDCGEVVVADVGGLLGVAHLVDPVTGIVAAMCIAGDMVVCATSASFVATTTASTVAAVGRTTTIATATATTFATAATTV